jgi:signal peptidase II
MLKRLLILLVAALLCVGCDQQTKSLARTLLEPASEIHLLGGIVQLTLVENHGAFLSLGAALPPTIRFYLFTAVVAVGLAGGLLWLARAKLRPWAFLSAVLILSGGLGNFIDRVTNGGAVIDFVSVGIGPLRTGIFNVADLYITTGVCLLAFLQLRGSGESSHENPAEKEEPTR